MSADRTIDFTAKQQRTSNTRYLTVNTYLLTSAEGFQNFYSFPHTVRYNDSMTDYKQYKSYSIQLAYVLIEAFSCAFPMTNNFRLVLLEVDKT